MARARKFARQAPAVPSGRRRRARRAGARRRWRNGVYPSCEPVGLVPDRWRLKDTRFLACNPGVQGLIRGSPQPPCWASITATRAYRRSSSQKRCWRHCQGVARPETSRLLPLRVHGFMVQYRACGPTLEGTAPSVGPPSGATGRSVPSCSARANSVRNCAGAGAGDIPCPQNAASPTLYAIERMGDCAAAPGWPQWRCSPPRARRKSVIGGESGRGDRRNSTPAETNVSFRRRPDIARLGRGARPARRPPPPSPSRRTVSIRDGVGEEA